VYNFDRISRFLYLQRFLEKVPHRCGRLHRINCVKFIRKWLNKYVTKYNISVKSRFIFWWEGWARNVYTV
jgi:hypothetical protein